MSDLLISLCTESNFGSSARGWEEYFMEALLALFFPCGSAGLESAYNVGDLGLIPGLGRSPGEGKGYPLQYSSLENSTDCIVHAVAELDMTEQLSISI